MRDISLRDYIAVQVLNGWMAHGYESCDETFRAAYEAADAVMLIREEQTRRRGCERNFWDEK